MEQRRIPPARKGACRRQPASKPQHKRTTAWVCVVSTHAYEVVQYLAPANSMPEAVACILRCVLALLAHVLGRCVLAGAQLIYLQVVCAVVQEGSCRATHKSARCQHTCQKLAASGHDEEDLQAANWLLGQSQSAAASRVHTLPIMQGIPII